MPNNNIANPGKQVDPSERTIDGAQNLQTEELSTDDEQDGSVLDEADDSGGVGTE